MPIIISDGSADFSGGANSIKPTTIADNNVPNGLARNEMAWLLNCRVRDGGISPRAGWTRLGKIWDSSGRYQRGSFYAPVSGDNPYLMLGISGQIITVDPDNLSSIRNLSQQFSLSFPASYSRFYFQQAEQFMVIQAGDGIAPALFWDGATMRQSNGITGNTDPLNGPVNEIPSATVMDYYMGRLWYAVNRKYTAGDIVGGPAGTLPYKFIDSVLKVTENPLALGGDGFSTGSNDGNIRALRHSAVLDSSLGQGRLYVFTRKAVYSLQVPVTRTDWINASSANGPLQTIVQLSNGSTNDDGIVPVNGDLFYQSFDPAIRSLIAAVRYFEQWGNIPISANENRILQFNDRALLRYASGLYFDNRLLMTALPAFSPQGTIHQALVPLDFVPISSFGANLVPIWEGAYEGLQILQVFEADFGGRPRAFATTVSELDGSIELWELTQGELFDTNAAGESRVTWIIETPAYTCGNINQLKKLVSAEFWIDRVYGTSQVIIEFRPDGESCWVMWHEMKFCAARNTSEDAVLALRGESAYPPQDYGFGYKQTVTLPLPPDFCTQLRTRPVNIGYQFQLRLTIKGACRIRKVEIHCEQVERDLYADMAQCGSTV